MIGKGHFAKVYMASHNATKAVYAVKAFSKDYLDG
jgi:serine/threonine protein kinase